MSDTTQTPAIPPEIAPYVAMVEAYWSYNAAEQAALTSRFDKLSWPELLRLHHLNCMEVLQDESVRKQIEPNAVITAPSATPSEALARCVQTGERLLATESPYRPRLAAVWRSPNDPGKSEPTVQGEFCNPSLTHLGCLEVLRLDEQQKPRELAFVAFDDLRDIAFATPRLFPAARLFYDDGRADEIVFLPLLYATSWRCNEPHLPAGRATMFLNYPPGGGPVSQFGIGVGQQDFAINKDGGRSLFGLGSVTHVALALSVDDPRFVQKCHARGWNPADVLRQVRREEGN